MLRPETLDAVRVVMQRYDKFGGWNVHTPFITVKWQRVDDPPEDHATYLDVQWALEQIRAWGRAIRSDMPMVQVRRAKARGAR